MRTVSLEVSHPYDILIGSGLLPQIGSFLADLHRPCRVLLVTDDRVGPLYLSKVAASLEKAGFSVHTCSIPAGEGSKNLTVYGRLLACCAETRLDRTDILLSLGGGVPGDLTGFVAATYLRGLDWVQVPTSLLAMVDAAVGGKTGLDLPQGKNLVGAFHHPCLVLCDPDCLRTLPSPQMQQGAAEMIKHGAIADEALFQQLAKEQLSEKTDWENLLLRNIQIKAAFVQADERDRGQRQLLNFGHTLGHGMEAASAYALSHGEAVAMGMAAEARAAYVLGKSPVHPEILEEALVRQGLPVRCGLSAQAVAAAASQDKKRRGDQLQMTRLTALGAAELFPLPIEELPRFAALGGLPWSD